MLLPKNQQTIENNNNHHSNVIHQKHFQKQAKLKSFNNN